MMRRDPEIALRQAVSERSRLEADWEDVLAAYDEAAAVMALADPFDGPPGRPIQLQPDRQLRVLLP
jgi:hypothetical protein